MSERPASPSATPPTGVLIDKGPEPTSTPGDGRGTARPASRPTGGVISFMRSEVVTSTACLVIFFLIIVVAYGLWLGHTFLNANSRVFDVYQDVPAMFIALAATVCLIANQFDLSIGSVATLSVFMTIGLTTNQHLPVLVSILLSLLMGAAVGLVNGFLVVRLRVNAFIATLGTQGLLAGIAAVYSGGETITPTSRPLPTWFTGPSSLGGFSLKAPLWLSWIILVVLALSALAVARDRWPEAMRRRPGLLAIPGAVIVVLLVLLALGKVPQQINWGIVILLVVAWALWLVMRYTVFGRSLYAIGGNARAARLNNVAVGSKTVVVFVMSGVLAALGGVLIAANQGTAVPDVAASYLLPAYAATFLSTVILSAGRFHIWGTLLGSIVVVYVAHGLVQGGIAFTWTDVINGAVLIVAVAFSTALRRSSAR